MVIPWLSWGRGIGHSSSGLTTRTFKCAVLSFCVSASAIASAPNDDEQADAAGVVAAERFAAPVDPNTLYLRAGAVNTAEAGHGRGLVARAGRVLGERWVVQLDGPMTPERRARLEAAGVGVGGYIPSNAYIVDMDRAEDAAMEALEFVQWRGRFEPEWKIDPSIGLRPYATPERIEEVRLGRARVEITLFAGAAPDAVLADLRAIPGARVGSVFEVAGSMVIQAALPFEDAFALANLPEVQFIEDAPENTERSNTNTRWIVQSNVAVATPFYAAGLHGEGQIIGHIDTALDINHCSFRDDAVGNVPGPTHRKVLAYNTTTGAASHGTHTAGTVAGDADADTDTRGVAYLAKLVHHSIPSPQNETNLTTRLDLHYSQGARIHTNSWGDDATTAYTGQCRAIDAHTYANEESLVLFAVTNTPTLKTPENAKNCVAVGASGAAGSQQNFCSGGAGPTNDGRRKPEIFAPGCGSISSQANTACSTVSNTGTSMACPAVAGVAALVRQYFMEGFYPSGAPNMSDEFTPSAALIKAMILNSGVDMTGIAGYPSNQEGWGRILADNSAFFSGDTRKLIVRDVRNIDGLVTTDPVVPVEIGLNVLAGTPLRITLVWSDPPASAGANPAGVNNLDLEVVAPGGSLYYGNVFLLGESATGGAPDARDNVEMVMFASPVAGPWLVRIRPTGVALGAQGYALVVTGNTFEGPIPLSISASNVPSVMLPGETGSFDVTVSPGDDSLVLDSTELHYRDSNAAGFTSTPLVSLGGDLYRADLPAAFCDDAPEFYVSAEGVSTGVVTSPFAGASAPYTLLIGEFETPISDDLETDTGWTTSFIPSGGGLASGHWVRDDPIGTDAQPEDDHTVAPGVNCWFTGQGTIGGALGEADVDSGSALLVSPVFDLAGLQDPVVSFWIWYSNSGGAAPGQDIFTVELSNNGGAVWTPVLQIGPSGAGTGGGWIRYQISPASFMALSNAMRLRFNASDLGAGSLVEAAVDDLEITTFGCINPPCDGDADRDGTVDFDDILSVLANWGGSGPLGDADNNGTVDYNDVISVLANWGLRCNE